MVASSAVHKLGDPFSIQDDEECQKRILAAKEELGERLVILGHH